MRPYAVVRAAIILAFLALVLLSVVPLLMPAKHVRSTDVTGLPKQQTDSHPARPASPVSPISPPDRVPGDGDR
jgi:hypothetical protein